MSRVDDAMRRAAGITVEEVPNGAWTSAVPEDPPSAVFEAPVDPEPSELPPLIDRIDPRLAQKVVVDGRVPAVSREEYRRLAAALHHAQASRDVRVVMVASALPGEGKTLTASNLALTFSESYHRKVLLMDGDLRQPGVHMVFGVQNAGGLADGLSASSEPKVAVQQVSPRLAVLTAGVTRPEPMATLTSHRMRRLLNEAKEHFDWVLVDTPPVGLLSDANLLASMVDAAVLVVRAGVTPFDLVQRAIDAIGRDRVIGVVLNRADECEHPSELTYHDPYYGSRRQMPR